MARQSGAIEFAPVGSPLENGYDLGGARIYPFSTGLAITPPAEYSNYIGSASGLPIQPPVDSTPATTGLSSMGALQTIAATNNPFSLTMSPLVWVVLGLFGAVVAMHLTHYK